jgi:hypothetical protein
MGRGKWVVVIAALCIGLLLGRVVPPGMAESATTASVSGVAGRYQIFYGPLTVKESFMVDTATGRCWQLCQDPDSKETFWSQTAYESLAPERGGTGTP